MGFKYIILTIFIAPGDPIHISMKYSDSDLFIKKVGKQLKVIRKKKGLTQLEVGRRAGLEESAVQRIEAGRINSTLKSLLKIVNVLDIEFSTLFVFDDKE